MMSGIICCIETFFLHPGANACVVPLPSCSPFFAVFPRGCTFSTVKIIACCPCIFVRVTFKPPVAKVTKLPSGGRGSFHVAWLHILVFFTKMAALLSFAVLPTRCLLVVSRLHDLSVLSLLSVVVTEIS